MPTVLSSVMRAQIKLAKPILKKLDIAAERKAQDALGMLGAKALAGRVEYVSESFSNFEAEWARNTETRQNKGILYLHGGSYSAGSLLYAKGFGGILAEMTGCDTLCIGYRLAPEDPFPAALDDATEAYRRVLERFDAKDVVLVGESAGGGLEMCLAHNIKKQGLPMPSGIVALSPWTDLSCSNPSYIANEVLDPSLVLAPLKFSAGAYSKGDYLNPLISPIHGDVTGFPPTLIIAGSHEMLMDDSILFADKLRQAGVPVTCHVEYGMWHVYALYGVPESKEALKMIKRFIAECLEIEYPDVEDD